jgi:hypothetical protein
MGSREQALIREFPNGETHLRSLLLRRDASMTRGDPAQGLASGRGGSAFFCLRAEGSDLWTNRDQKKVLIL